MSTYHFDKNFIPRQTLAEQLEALKAKLKKEEELWAPTQPFDDDDLDEVEHGPSETGR